MEVSRIREMLEARQLSPTQFADLIGVGRPVISHILSGRNEPSLKVVRSIIEAFPDISLAWIMTGTGPMLGTPTPTTPASDTATMPASAASQPVNAPPAAIPAPFVAPAPPVAPPPPVISPLPTAASQVFAVPAPTLAAVSPPVAPIQQLPQPPKFRPLAKAAPQPELARSTAVPPSLPATAPTLPAPVATPASLVAPPIMPAAPAIMPAPEPIAPVEASPAPAPLVAALPVAPAELPPLAPPVYSTSPEHAKAESVPTSSAAIASATPNPAAAFSFLGEAGKTIRRIVIFYNDGSFSNYQPEGQ